ncbi:MAG: PadR family transcriptional regulator [Candidatus Methanosuratincola verstraetei]|jgi:DNA-binding PadR family transcriptional regulator
MCHRREEFIGEEIGREPDPRCGPPCGCGPHVGHPAFRQIPGREATPKGLLHLAILSLLKEKELHGGSIHQSLKEKFGVDPAKSIVYIMLRRMEKAGLLVSEWDTSEGGPAKRVYRITQEGLDYLEEATGRLRNAARIIRILLGEGDGPDAQRS